MELEELPPTRGEGGKDMKKTWEGVGSMCKM